MGKVEDAIRSEVSRVVKREVRDAVNPVARDVRELRQALSRLEKSGRGGGMAPAGKSAPQGKLPRLDASSEEVSKARFSPALIRKLRERLGVTQAQLAALLGVTGPAIAQWEGGQSEPRGSNRAKLVALRKLGRRDVGRLLADKGAGAPKTASAVRKARRKKG